MKKPNIEVYDRLEDVEETLKGVYVAVLIADAEPDSITSENMVAYMKMLSQVIDTTIQNVREIKGMLMEE